MLPEPSISSQTVGIVRLIVSSARAQRGGASNHVTLASFAGGEDACVLASIGADPVGFTGDAGMASAPAAASRSISAWSAHANSPAHKQAAVACHERARAEVG